MSVCIFPCHILQIPNQVKRMKQLEAELSQVNGGVLTIRVLGKGILNIQR
jgi:hypothetical protein